MNKQFILLTILSICFLLVSSEYDTLAFTRSVRIKDYLKFEIKKITNELLSMHYWYFSISDIIGKIEDKLNERFRPKTKYFWKCGFGQIRQNSKCEKKCFTMTNFDNFVTSCYTEKG